MADEQNLDDQQRAELRTRLAYPILQAFENGLKAIIRRQYQKEEWKGH